MDASLVNVFVSELVKFKTGGQNEGMNEAEKPHQVQTEDEDSIPKPTEDELVQLQDQMRKVRTVLLFYN